MQKNNSFHLKINILLAYLTEIVRAKRDKTNYCIFVLIRSARVKEIYKNNVLYERYSFLYYRRCDVLGFCETQFLTDLGLALVDSLETLTGEHIDLLGGEICFQQTT